MTLTPETIAKIRERIAAMHVQEPAGLRSGRQLLLSPSVVSEILDSRDELKNRLLASRELGEQLVRHESALRQQVEAERDILRRELEEVRADLGATEAQRDTAITQRDSATAELAQRRSHDRELARLMDRDALEWLTKSLGERAALGYREMSERAHTTVTALLDLLDRIGKENES